MLSKAGGYFVYPQIQCSIEHNNLKDGLTLVDQDQPIYGQYKLLPQQLSSGFHCVGHRGLLILFDSGRRLYSGRSRAKLPPSLGYKGISIFTLNSIKGKLLKIFLIRSDSRMEKIFNCKSSRRKDIFHLYLFIYPILIYLDIPCLAALVCYVISSRNGKGVILCCNQRKNCLAMTV